MPHKDPEAKKAYFRKYNQERKPWVTYERNKVKQHDYNNNYYQQNKERIKKQQNINKWKKWNIPEPKMTWSKYYDDIYKCATSCEWCGKGGRMNLEHNHSSKEIRGIVCGRCNKKEEIKDKNFRRVMLSIVSCVGGV
jgi:hypothetical protein